MIIAPPPRRCYRWTGFTRKAKQNFVWHDHAAALPKSALGNHVLLEQCLLALGDCDEDARAAGLRAVYEQAGLSIDDHTPEPIPEYEILEKDAVPILLLWLCTDLETLRLSAGYWPHWHLEQYVKLVNYGRLHGLANVKRVEFATPAKQSEDDRFFDVFQFTRSMLLIHRLPSLETVLLEAVREPQTEYPGAALVPRCGNFKRLDLSFVDVSYQTFAALLAIPKELESLKLWMGGLCSTDGSAEWVARYAWRLLLPHQHTLTALDIDTDTSIFWHCPGYLYYDDNDDDEYAASDDGEEEYEVEEEVEELTHPVFEEFKEADQAIGSNYVYEDIQPTNKDAEHVVYGSFAEFKALKHLRIVVRSLLGPPAPPQSMDGPTKLHDSGVRLVDSLPPSLESFALYGYERGYCKDVDDQLDELMQVKAEKFPLLVSIEGVQDTIGSIVTQHGYNPKEGQEWDRGEQDWGWK